MKITILATLLSCGTLFGAAPDSIAGRVFRDYLVFSGITNAAETPIVFGADGRYHYLKYAFGVVRAANASGVLPEVHWGAIQDPPSDGTYRYERTGESTGTLTMIPDSSAQGSSMTLRFNSLTSGSTSPTGLSGLGGATFYLTDAGAQRTAPVSNVSLRGGSPMGDRSSWVLPYRATVSARS